MISKPMLAVEYLKVKTLNFPVLATPKLDGIRALKIDGKLVSRTFKPIQNVYIRETLERLLPDGIDGEIIVGKNFQETSSAVMKRTGEPDFVYHAFDYVKEGLNVPYGTRHQHLVMWMAMNLLADEKRIVSVDPIRCENMEELMALEQRFVDEGYEGTMTRTEDSPYKCGRATPVNQWLVKIKRWSDSEAEIIGFEEKMHNANEATKDAFGRTKRSTCKDNMVPANSLGAFVVRDIYSGVELSVAGFNDQQKREWWDDRESLLGKIVKYKYIDFGVKEAPRFPGFLGFRDESDIGEPDEC